MKSLIPIVLSGVIMFMVGAYWASNRAVDGETVVVEDQATVSKETLVRDEDPPEQINVVTGAIDGITIQVAGGQRVRYLGARTPRPLRCFGDFSKTANEEMIGETVRLESDPVIDRARDGAWIRYVWLLPNEEAQANEDDPDDVLVNERIIERGWGFLHASEELLHAKRMQAAAQYAAATSKGLWAECEVAKDEETGLLMTQEEIVSDSSETATE